MARQIQYHRQKVCYFQFPDSANSNRIIVFAAVVVVGIVVVGKKQQPSPYLELEAEQMETCTATS